jgi:DNA polymerase I-like protein with 3'-5' exonuclease and polymerase domains
MSSNKILALDIETTGLDPWRDQIHMVGLWDGERYTCCRNPSELGVMLGWEGRDYYKDHELVGHNVAFDIKFLEVQGWWKPDGRIIHDTKILAHLMKNKVPQEFVERYETMRKDLNKTLPKGQTHREGSPLSLKVLAPWYLKVPPFWETPGNHNNEEYNQKDCMYTYRLFHQFAAQVRAEGSWEFYTERMLQWSKMIMEMEIKGIRISMEELGLVEQEYTAKRDALKIKLDEQWADAHKQFRNQQISILSEEYGLMRDKQIEKGDRSEPKVLKIWERYQRLFEKAVERIDTHINYASPAQMSWLLKEYLGLDITDPEGEESTGKAVLNKLASEGREDIKTYLEWREADKVLTMYLPTYRELQVDSVIHPSFNLTGTRTGRTSSSGPNLQQVPSKLYRLFKPRPGYKFIQYDLSGIEAALIALYSGDKFLYGILERGESIHDHNVLTLAELFGLNAQDYELADVSTKLPKQRRCVKNIGFAIFYGAGWKRISQVFAAGGFPITDAQAKWGLQRIKDRHPEAFMFHKEITEIFESGETVTNLLGRPLNIQPWENAYMQGFNTLIQSSASDLNLLACERAWKQWQNELAPDEAYPLLVIHDCIMAEASIERPGCAADLAYHMTNFKLESVNGPIKLRVEGGISDHWAK